MDYREELIRVMDEQIDCIRGDKFQCSNYMIGLIKMKCIVKEYLKDKEIIQKSTEELHIND